MDKQQLILHIRQKKLGLLIVDARLAARRSPVECAHAMGLSPEEYTAVEKGEMAPILPQVESLASFLNVPLQHFWGKASLSAQGIWDSEQIQRRIEARNRAIAAFLQTSREKFGETIAEIASRTGLPADQILAYEEGSTPIPVPALDVLCNLYGLNIPMQSDSPTAPENPAEPTTQMPPPDLPEHIHSFISSPANYPYIELAKRLSELPSKKLRAIAESIMEITL